MSKPTLKYWLRVIKAITREELAVLPQSRSLNVDLRILRLSIILDASIERRTSLRKLMNVGLYVSLNVCLLICWSIMHKPFWL